MSHTEYIDHAINDVKEKYNAYDEGIIKNRSDNLEEYDDFQITRTPVMEGRNGPALYEIHIFLGNIWIEGSKPVNEEIVEKYKDVIQMYNDTQEDKPPSYKGMKDPVLVLKFEKEGYITVLQSSLYYLTNSKKEVIDMTHKVAELFKNAGFTIIREKIEISIHGVNGIPNNTEDMLKYDGYFEFHIRIGKKENEGSEKTPMSNEEINQLEIASEHFKEKFKIPVPLSYNRNKNDINGGYQRYLNVRFRDVGVSDAVKKVNEIKEYINDTSIFKVEKSIDEYIIYDTFVSLDKGWIDFDA